MSMFEGEGEGENESEGNGEREKEERINSHSHSQSQSHTSHVKKCKYIHVAIHVAIQAWACPYTSYLMPHASCLKQQFQSPHWQKHAVIYTYISVSHTPYPIPQTLSRLSSLIFHSHLLPTLNQPNKKRRETSTKLKKNSRHKTKKTKKTKKKTKIQRGIRHR